MAYPTCQGNQIIWRSFYFATNNPSGRFQPPEGAIPDQNGKRNGAVAGRFREQWWRRLLRLLPRFGLLVVRESLFLASDRIAFLLLKKFSVAIPTSILLLWSGWNLWSLLFFFFFFPLYSFFARKLRVNCVQ